MVRTHESNNGIRDFDLSIIIELFNSHNIASTEKTVKNPTVTMLYYLIFFLKNKVCVNNVFRNINNLFLSTKEPIVRNN